MKTFKKFIILISRDGFKQEKVIDSPEFSIGRSVDLQLSLADPNVSRKHLSVLAEQGFVYILDEESANGTFVNKAKIKPQTKTQVTKKDSILVGSSGFELRIEAFWESVDLPKVQEQVVNQPETQSIKINKPIVALKNESEIESIVSKVQLDKAMVEPSQEAVENSEQLQQLQRQLEELKSEIQKNEELQFSLKQEEVEIKSLVEKTKNEKSALEVELEQIYEKTKLAQEKLTQLEESIDKARIEERVQKERLQENYSFEEKKLIKEFERKREQQEQQIKIDLADILQEKKSVQLELDEIRAKILLYKEDEINWSTKEAYLKSECLIAQDKINQLAEQEIKIKNEIDLNSKETSKSIDDLNAKKIENENLATKISEAKEQLNSVIQETLSIKSKNYDIEVEFKKNKQAHLDLVTEVTALNSEKHKIIDQLSNYKQNKIELEEKINRYNQELKQKQDEHQSKIDQFQLNILNLKTQQDQKMIELKDKFQKEMNFYETTKRNELETQVKNDRRRLNSYRLELIESSEKALIQLVIPYLETAHQKPVFSGISDILTENIEAVLAKNELSVEANRVELSSGSKSDLQPKKFWQALSAGVAIGLLALPAYHLLSRSVSPTVSPNNSSIQNSQKESDEQVKRFLPEQTDLWYANITHLVIYNQNFSKWYLDQDYQRELNTYVIALMFKLWRTEEEVSIKALSRLYSLVSDLEEKRSNINPDFVKQNIAKMNEVELDTQAQLEKLLGSKVRYESFIKAQKDFYTSYLSKLRLSEQN